MVWRFHVWALWTAQMLWHVQNFCGDHLTILKAVTRHIHHWLWMMRNTKCTFITLGVNLVNHLFSMARWIDSKHPRATTQGLQVHWHRQASGHKQHRADSAGTIMTSWHENPFGITAPLCGRNPVTDGFPSQKTSNVECCFLWWMVQ